MAVGITVIAAIVFSFYLLGVFTPSDGPSQTTGPIGAATGSLDIALTLADSEIVRGNVQTVTLRVSSEGAGVAGVSIGGTVIYSGGFEERFAGQTDDNGAYVYGWRIGTDALPGLFYIGVDASKDGYLTARAAQSFEVFTSEPITTTLGG